MSKKKIIGSMKAGAPPSTPPSPTRRERAFYFVLGAIVGGVIGYGLVTGGPDAPSSLLEPMAAAWILGSAAICGSLAALSPKAFLRPGGRFRWRHDPDD